MNADRMISVFLAGVLVGGSVVYLSPNNSLAVGVPGGQKQGGSTGVSGGKSGSEGGGGQGGGAQTGGGQSGGGQSGGGGQGGAGQGSEGQGGGGGTSSSGLGDASAGMAGAGPGTQGSQEMSPSSGGAGTGGDGGMSGGGGGSSGGVTGSGGTVGGETEASPISAQPVSGAPRGATRLLRHLQLAPTLWKAQAEAALASPDAKVRELAAKIAAHAASVPTVSDRMPPNTEVVAYLVDSKLLLERMKLLGMDVGSLESQVDEVSRSRK